VSTYVLRGHDPSRCVREAQDGFAGRLRCAQMKSLLKALDAKAAELNDRPVRKAA
jgi:hypothetical protein